MSYNKSIHNPYVPNPDFHPNYEMLYGHRHHKQDQILDRIPFLYQQATQSHSNLAGSPYSIQPSESLKNEVVRGRDPLKVMQNSIFADRECQHPMVSSLGHKQQFIPGGDFFTSTDHYRTQDHVDKLYYLRYKDYNRNYELENEVSLSTRPKLSSDIGNNFSGVSSRPKQNSYNYPYTFQYHQDANNQEVRHPKFYSSDHRYFPYTKNFLDNTPTQYIPRQTDPK